MTAGETVHQFFFTLNTVRQMVLSDTFCTRNSVWDTCCPAFHGTGYWGRYAQRERDVYAAKFRDAIAPTGFDVRSLHECADAASRRAAVEGASAVFVGGGNTFRLLKCLQPDQPPQPTSF